MISGIIAKIKDDHLKELLRGSSEAFILKIIGMSFGYVFTLLITRLYGAETMGIFALSLTLLTIFSVVGRLGFDTSLVRFVAEYSYQSRPDSMKEIYIKSLKIVVPVCLLLTLLLFMSSPLLARHVFSKEHLTPYFRMISLAILPLVLIVLHSSSLRGLKKIKEYSFLQDVSIPLISILLLASSLFIVSDERSPLAVYVLSLIIVFVCSCVVWLKHSNIKSFSHSNNIKVRTILSVSLPMLLSHSSFLILEWTDTIMLGVLRTGVEIGIYNVAMKISILTSITLFAINSIAAPKFAEFYKKGDREGLEKIIRQSTKLIFWSTVSIIFIIFLFPSFILGIFGEEFKTALYALMILTFGQFINAISGSVGYILQMTGKQKVFQYIVLTAAIMNIGLNAILIPHYGINGAALASMLSMAFWNLSSVMFIRSYLKITTIYIPGLTR
jgi:O-antigen/teichoic acid export membrane protein